MMQHQTASFKSANGNNTHTEAWLPDGDARAVLLISHGVNEHIGRYANVAARLVEEGYAVYGLDHRGHGKSDGLRGYFADFDEPIEDLKQFVDQVKAAQPGKKLFLYGHSLGSLIALVFALRFQADLAGLIISGTPLEAEATQPRWLVAISGLLDTLIPRAPVVALPTAYLTSDQSNLQARANDPLVRQGSVRTRIGYQVAQNSRMVKARLSEITLPLLVIHGGEDKICPPAGGETLYQGAGSPDKTLKVYPGLYHEIHNETPAERKQVLDDIAGWLNQHSARSGAKD